MNVLAADGAVALVSGANRGLGRAVATLLADRGVTTFAGCREPASGPDHPGVRTIQLDVTDPASVRRARDSVLDACGRLDFLVNNAGIYPDRPPPGRGPAIEELDPELCAAVFDVNVFGALRLTSAFLPTMRRRGYGRIVNVSSGRGRFADLDGSGPFYRISKAALNALTVIVAADTSGADILVNAVCPGWVRTDMGGPDAPRDVAEAAAGVAWAAFLPRGGPSGGFFRDGHDLDWCAKGTGATWTSG